MWVFKSSQVANPHNAFCIEQRTAAKAQKNPCACFWCCFLPPPRLKPVGLIEAPSILGGPSSSSICGVAPSPTAPPSRCLWFFGCRLDLKDSTQGWASQATLAAAATAACTCLAPKWRRTSPPCLADPLGAVLMYMPIAPFLADPLGAVLMHMPIACAGALFGGPPRGSANTFFFWYLRNRHVHD